MKQVFFNKADRAEKKEKRTIKKRNKELKKQANKQMQEDVEFASFFSEVLTHFPEKTKQAILGTYGKTKGTAEKVLEKSRDRFNGVFDEFLVDVDDETRKKCHSIIHAASLSAAIVGCSPIPFSDAFLLVPIQLTMMSRLHKLFGQSWAEGMGKSLSKELVVVGLGRSAVGNIMKFIPAVGTVAGAAVNATVASAITESLGWVTVKMLNDGEDIFDQVLTFKGQFKTVFGAIQGAKK